MDCQNATGQWNTYGCYECDVAITTRRVNGRHWGYEECTCTTVWCLFILCNTASAMQVRLQHMAMSRLLCPVYQGSMRASDPRLTPLLLALSSTPCFSLLMPPLAAGITSATSINCYMLCDAALWNHCLPVHKCMASRSCAAYGVECSHSAHKSHA